MCFAHFDDCILVVTCLATNYLVACRKNWASCKTSSHCETKFLTCGEIPDQLTSCLSLATLNVSYNNFAGVIPVGRNFPRFPPDSFIGNRLLRGNWLGSVKHFSYISLLNSGPRKLMVLHMGSALHTYEDIMLSTENLSEKYIIGCCASSTVYKWSEGVGIPNTGNSLWSLP
ncbi:unnamed protein product [Coffea canephora]|uniref:DH200=94 genomic scaffold, scaffold_1831 n=1 Tax=Coffea canephora TaxID=49390 RepID=A0A068VJE3_COFCA|nr:unnamed protein product [Coffea canephora]